MDKESFLKTISQIESSGGKNLNHKEINSGIQAGSSAYGEYGLMPNTIREMANRAGLNNISNLDDENLKSKLDEDPSLKNKIIETLYNHLNQKESGDPLKMAYAWNQGHNLTPDKISDENLQKSDYVNKFKNLSKVDSSNSVSSLQQVPNLAKMINKPSAPISQDPISLPIEDTYVAKELPKEQDFSPTQTQLASNFYQDQNNNLQRTKNMFNLWSSRNKGN